MKQFYYLTDHPEARVIVCVQNRAKVLALMRLLGFTGAEALYCRKTYNNGAVVTILNTDPNDGFEVHHLGGIQGTNAVYDMDIDQTLMTTLIPFLRCRLRSATYRDTFTLEPLLWEYL